MNDPDRNSFQTTHWSIVQAAVDSDDLGRDAMQELCGRYWFPLYAFLRRRGCQEQQAQDLIQAFFLRLLEKDVLRKADRERGRFRSFLLASLKHFVSNESAKDHAVRRGGGRAIASLDFRDAEGRLATEAIDGISPDAHFHRQWAVEVLDRAMAVLRRELESEGKAELFASLRPYLSVDSRSHPYEAVAENLGMQPEAVRVATHRLRRRYRKCLEAEIGETVSTREEVEQEIQELFVALRVAPPPVE
ncbi:MAG: RNA polymerase sigma factor [Rubripirellula sp.]